MIAIILLSGTVALAGCATQEEGNEQAAVGAPAPGSDTAASGTYTSVPAYGATREMAER
jgi:hypothetical protein